MEGQKIKQDIGLGRNIKRLRQKAGLTQEMVIAKMQLLGCGVTRIAYVKIEGETQHIRVSELMALKEILGVEYNDFFVEEKQEPTKGDNQDETLSDPPRGDSVE